MMNETLLKQKLMYQLRAALPSFVCERHEDIYRSGWPDISVSGHGRTSFWEVKYVTESRVRTTEIQKLTCRRLAHAAFHCRFVLFEDRKGVRRTLVVHPDSLFVHEYVSERSWDGHDFASLVAHVGVLHTEL